MSARTAADAARAVGASAMDGRWSSAASARASSSEDARTATRDRRGARATRGEARETWTWLDVRRLGTWAPRSREARPETAADDAMATAALARWVAGEV